MSDATTALTKAIADAIYAKVPKQAQTSMPATYQGKDAEGKAWVLLPGATSPTPVKRMAVEAKQGDTVSVTVGNGRATVDSNISNPSAGLAGVKKVEKTANDAKSTAVQAIDYASAAQAAALAASQGAETAAAKAEEAQESADTAHAAAETAIADAATAHEAADAAVQDAAIANDAASRAQESADEAQASANTAAGMANAAGASLAEVENVVGVLNWITQHGSFVLTSDEAPMDGKLYYTLEGGEYALTEDTALVEHKQYYAEDGEGGYVPVTSPDVSEIENYYERSGMGVLKVDSPVAGDIGTYYEAWVGDSVQNYIASHLWLDDYGLNLTVDASYVPTQDTEPVDGKTYYVLENGVFTPVSSPVAADMATYYEKKNYRLHEGTVDGTKPMGLYVLDDAGASVSMFGETVRIGAESGTHVVIAENRMSFIANGQEVAYVAIDDNGESVFYMTKAIIVQDLRFGNWQWKSKDNGNLVLKWMGSDVQ